METTRETLTSVPHTAFEQLLVGNQEGELFLDRDAGRFQHVLNYLRDGTVYLPNEVHCYEALIEEAEFFNIVPLKSLLLSKLDRVGSEGARRQGAAPGFPTKFMSPPKARTVPRSLPQRFCSPQVTGQKKAGEPTVADITSTFELDFEDL